MKQQLRINEEDFLKDDDSFEGGDGGFDSDDANVEDAYESEEGVINQPSQLNCQYR